MNLLELYKLLGLSMKSRQRWLRLIIQKSNVPMTWDDHVTGYEFHSYILPFLVHGDKKAVIDAYFAMPLNTPKELEGDVKNTFKGKSYAECEKKESEIPEKDVKDPFKAAEEVLLLLMSRVEILEQQANYFVNKANEIADLIHAIDMQSSEMAIMGKALQDLQIMFSDTPKPLDELPPRGKIVAIVTRHAKNGKGTYRSLFNKLYREYEEYYGKGFIEAAHKQGISKLEYAEKCGVHVLNALLKIAESWQ